MVGGMLESRWVRLLIRWFVTASFAGYFPLAPGTAGTLVGVGLILLMGGVSPFWLTVLSTVLFVLGAQACDRARQFFQKPDDGRIVIDEVVGYMVTMIGIPTESYFLVFGFLIFRFFDVVKFEPAKYFDVKLKNGWGVMADDLIAGLYSNLILRLVLKAQI